MNLFVAAQWPVTGGKYLERKHGWTIGVIGKIWTPDGTDLSGPVSGLADLGCRILRRKHLTTITTSLMTSPPLILQLQPPCGVRAGMSSLACGDNNHGIIIIRAFHNAQGSYQGLTIIHCINDSLAALSAVMPLIMRGHYCNHCYFTTF